MSPVVPLTFSIHQSCRFPPLWHFLLLHFNALWPLISNEMHFSDSLLLRFSVCFQQILQRLFPSWSLTDFMTNAMNSWFCYKRFIFVLLLKELLCNSTEVATIANWKLCRLLYGALLSHRPSRVLTQSAFTVHYACVYRSIFSKSWRW